MTNVLTKRTLAIIGGAVSIVVVFGPASLWMLAMHGATTRFHDLINLSAVFQALGLALASYFCIRRAQLRQSTEDVIVAAIFSMAIAFYLAVINNSSEMPNSDYLCIQNGAWNILQHQLPYGQSTGYFLYPPMYAEAMASAYQMILLIGKQFHWHPEPAQTLDLIFYLFQNAQLAALIGLLYCSYLFVLGTGRLTKIYAAALSVAVIALNYPIKETIQWNQVNLFLTCLVMFACSSLQKLDCLRGLALAVGIHLKAYPALILPAWFLSGQRKACCWAILWTVAILGMTLGQFGLAIWTSYFATASGFIAKVTTSPQAYMLNGSCLYSLVYCAIKSIASVTGANGPISWHLVNSLCNILRIAAGVWFASRIARRHLPRTVRDADTTRSLFYDDVCDVLSFGLIAGPTTLNHHYVLAVPVILWTIVKSGIASPFITVVGCILILNFQSHVTTWMPLAPVGLVLLAVARKRDNAINSSQSIAGQQRSIEPPPSERTLETGSADLVLRR